MMEGQLVGSEIHGFHTLQDLDLGNIREEASTRWLRPNEIHAILCNYKNFSINVKPVNLPKSGTIVLFDRKMLRNFRKDGHNWKKKKDGKTVKEAHEHLKVGDEERIHVYYAHGQDNPTFVRRCYWLLDKSLEHIVLVHYRETQELQGSPGTPVNSNSSSGSSAPWLLTEELDSGGNHAHYGESAGTVQNHELRLHEINTLEWDDLLLTNDLNNSIVPKGAKVSSIDQTNQALNDSLHFGVNNSSAEVSSFSNLTEAIARSDNIYSSFPDSIYDQAMKGQLNANVPRRDSITMGTNDSLDILVDDGLQSQDSFGRWINQIMAESPEQIFSITDVSPAWAFSTEKTKIIVIGFFHKECLHLAKSSLLCVCGDVCVPAETVQVGVYRCFVLPHSFGPVSLFMSFDGHKPISQVLNFEYRIPSSVDPKNLLEEKCKWEDFQYQLRLAYLLFSTSKNLNILSNKVSPNSLKEAKNFAHKTSNILHSFEKFIKSVEENKVPFPQAKDVLFEHTLKNRLKEYLLERVVERPKTTEHSKTTEYDAQGRGVIHLCAILGYTWAVPLFSWSGLSLDFRDKYGWTALHWAAFCGREKMVAALLSAGAKPNLVTDPTPKNPGGSTAADLASLKGYEGLAAYLSEKALVEQFKDMSMAGNISGSLDTSATDTVITENLSEDQIYLKDTLAAYRTTAEAAARIQAAFRDHSLKVRTKEVEFSAPEDEARSIIAAMKIQHAFRSFESKKKMAAAARIQYRFRTWKIRKDFLTMRRHAIKIQAAFRGFQVRRQYRKILWSVGVLEKAVLRWRLKRRGFRGFQVDPMEPVPDQRPESDTEEDFYRASRKQAEERVERSVVRVQAMFRSKKAQEEYRRMKMTHNQARLEYEGFLDSDTDMTY
ncbi:calmodulin-binding transcription activator 5 isoform X3 [Quercus suber]|uniref:calmodulin-binding transcription activator 5 isoform X3 n=1 Tax=Quercus suber TaxID=58331 RepID=UPI000CE1CC4B|nr:calmodulin-binding transcription activator 5 isoform X3 [Quercus suber]